MFPLPVERARKDTEFLQKWCRCWCYSLLFFCTIVHCTATAALFPRKAAQDEKLEKEKKQTGTKVVLLHQALAVATPLQPTEQEKDKKVIINFITGNTSRRLETGNLLPALRLKIVSCFLLATFPLAGHEN